MIVPFKAEHLSRIALQEAQQFIAADLADPEYGRALENSYAYSLVDGDEVLACGGIMPIWKGRAMAWAIISANAGRRFIEIHRNTAAAIRLCQDRRLEIAVDCAFEQGQRWAKMLGFRHEARMTAYSPNGNDCDLYVRIRTGAKT